MTVAIDVLLLLQETFLFDAVSGRTVAVRLKTELRVATIDVMSNVTPVADVVTLKLQLAV